MSEDSSSAELIERISRLTAEAHIMPRRRFQERKQSGRINAAPELVVWREGAGDHQLGTNYPCTETTRVDELPGALTRLPPVLAPPYIPVSVAPTIVTFSTTTTPIMALNFASTMPRSPSGNVHSPAPSQLQFTPTGPDRTPWPGCRVVDHPASCTFAESSEAGDGTPSGLNGLSRVFTRPRSRPSYWPKDLPFPLAPRLGVVVPKMDLEVEQIPTISREAATRENCDMDSDGQLSSFMSDDSVIESEAEGSEIAFQSPSRPKVVMIDAATQTTDQLGDANGLLDHVQVSSSEPSGQSGNSREYQEQAVSTQNESGFSCADDENSSDSLGTADADERPKVPRRKRRRRRRRSRRQSAGSTDESSVTNSRKHRGWLHSRTKIKVALSSSASLEFSSSHEEGEADIDEWCVHCDGCDHRADCCPVRPCLTCNQLGHYSLECPEFGGPEPGSLYCPVCGMHNTTVWECLFCRHHAVTRWLVKMGKSPPPLGWCSYCHSWDHQLSSCPIRPCYTCHQMGHFSRECPLKYTKEPIPLNCRRCGKRGTTAQTCSTCRSFTSL